MSTSRRTARDADFTAFAEASMPQLYRAAWLLTGDRQHAEDLVQETLVKVYGRWGSSIDNPAAYAQTTLTRAWISRQRRRSSHERPVDVVPEAPQPGGDAALRLSLVAALAQLEPLDRAVVVLRYLDDVTTDDVASRLGLTNQAVRSRLLRSLRLLRVTLALPFADLVPEGTDR